MDDQPLDDSVTPKEPIPSDSTEAGEEKQSTEPTQTIQPAGVPATPAQPASVDTPSGLAEPPPKPIVSSSLHHWLRNSLIFIVLLGLVVVAILLINHKNKPLATIVTTKKDVSLLRYGVVNDGNVPDYPINTIGSVFSVEVNAQLFEGLVGYQSDSKIVPLLATSWDNPDNSTLVFNLRHNVKFHSGRTMTADDVKYTLDYAIAHQNDNAGTSVLGLANVFKEVDVVNPYQIKIVTSGPDPVMLSRLSLLGILDSKAKLGDYDAGTGPYEVKAGTTPTSLAIDMVASNNYWGGHVYTRELDIKVYDDVNKLVSDSAIGKVDLAGEFNTKQIAQAKPLKKLYVTDEGTDFIGINTENANSPLANKTARQAISYALNVPAILKAGNLNGSQVSQLVPQLLPGFNPAITNVSYNPSKAKQLLSSVANISQPVTLAYNSNNSGQSEEIIKELQAVGFNIKSLPITALDELANNAVAGKYDLFIYGYSSSFQDGQDILSGVLQGNMTYSNPQVDDLLQQTGNTLNQSARIKDMQKIATIVNNDKPYVPLYTLNRIYAINKPYVLKSDMPGMVTGVYFWKVYQQ